ncbi:unnamed protein product [Rotaria socialis]|uniref:protein-tyrosine-phosphatase n=2 Tax=Rotaria socialis TaxID=392032 RepID=A0A819VS59_9BILA|nr:unnamed protein product [Rotaria socialis]CAF3366582.1 unnamed protein product [Rotaria socialis]CAF3694388.1 unnamed protein product [Rotaria socialis]CAF4112859.1 unnamed protein product [Rotaria socialis]CAF4597861.1 unnamed protein product [Rotaria socialis]
MTKNPDDDSICSRTERLINEFEQTHDPDSTVIGRQFAQLQQKMMETKEKLSSTEGAKPLNRLKNRYKDVLPYDTHRVILEQDNNSDYINASFIEDFSGNRRYIAAQGPIDQSISDFLRMIWEFQITSVICTANEIEAGRLKFRRYWPDDDNSVQFGSYRVSKDETSDKAFSCEHYEIRPLIISQGENRRHILLYHFLHWLDHDVPNDEAPILDLLLRLYDDRNLSPDTPILVHCSAGCGRTGSIIAIDLCRFLIRDERLLLSKKYQPYPVYEIATHIRQFRIALIQTIKQYLFVYKMFVFMMKANGNVSLCSSASSDENQPLNVLSTTKSSSPSITSSSTRRPSGSCQIKLGNPPLGRRLTNGISTSNNPSSTVSSSEIYAPSSKSSSVNDEPQKFESPPPIPPRVSLFNTTNKPIEGQFVRPGETPIKAKRTIFRSRNVKRREPTTTPTTAATVSTSKYTRSDSADALSVKTSGNHYRNSARRLAVQVEKAANSD